jgi:tRNA modification GTPase
MALYAAAMTGKGIGAIATVQIFGDDAQRVLASILKPAGARHAEFKTGTILLGSIVDGDKTIDRVTIGCEGPATFAIHCHGNPLIVEMIMELLVRHGAELISAEELLRRILTANESLNTIAIEAKLAQLNAKTLTGTKILANQIDGGLAKWLENAKTAPLDQIAAEAEQILADSRAAKLIIAGCTIVLAGPPNSGKSTLLNRLAGRQKAIVTDIEGTTRDWVSAQCQIGPLSVTLIDTAGLDEKLAATSRKTIEKAAQEMTARILIELSLSCSSWIAAKPPISLQERSLRQSPTRKS